MRTAILRLARMSVTTRHQATARDTTYDSSNGARVLAPVDLSVVIVTYQSAGCIAGCLASVGDHLPGCEAIVVDNASTDGSPDVATRFRGVHAIRLTDNIGFGRACNLGATAATRSHILFLNPDVTLVSAHTAEL